MKNRYLALVLAGSLAFSTVGCSLFTNGTPTIDSETIVAIVNLVGSFYNFNGTLTAQELTALETYLESTKTPDIMTIAQMLIADGVIPTGSALTPQQLAAIVGLLYALGFNPTINGAAPNAEQLAPHHRLAIR